MRDMKACPRCGGTGYDPAVLDGHCRRIPTPHDRAVYESRKNHPSRGDK